MQDASIENVSPDKPTGNALNLSYQSIGSLPH